MESTPRIKDSPTAPPNAADKLSAESPDSQLTGNYYVSGARYHYDRMHPNGLYTELILSYNFLMDS